MNYLESKKQIIKFGKKLGAKNMTPGTSGNISTRADENILITASGTCLADLLEEEIVLMDMDSNVIEGTKPSSEKGLHTAIYKLRPDIGAIFHCHSPYASAFAVSHVPLSKPIISENVFYFGEIPVAEYALPGSDKLVENTIKYFEKNDAVLLANHGIVVCAKNLKEAYYRMETAETYAQIYLNSMLLGGAKDLSPKDIEEIYALKKAATC
ncbi:MAG: class II aldolase/adducin family protein [Clostridium sp.]|nr:class II aldolase/adducin family protein [Clostridium sp.]